MLSLPLQAFDFDSDRVLPGLRVSTNIFWTLMLPIPFFVGYVDASAGVVEMRVEVITRKHLRSWFLPDLAVVIVDWIMYYIIASASDAVSIARMGRAIRVARLFRFLRLLRIVEFV